MKYLTSVIFGHARAEDVVKDMLGVLDKLAIPLRLMLSLGMDGPNVNKSIMHKINQVMKEKGYQPLVKCPPSCPIHMCHNSFRKGMAQYGYSAEELCLTYTASLRGVHADEKTSLKLSNHLVLKS